MIDEIKRAIEYLAPITEHPTMTGEYCKNLKVAVKALREKAERDREIEWLREARRCAMIDEKQLEEIRARLIQGRIIRNIDVKYLFDLIEILQFEVGAAHNREDKADAALTEANRKAEAAIEEMKLIVDAVREKHCDETCCFACKFDCDTSITWTGDHANECPGFERDDCFEWRGVEKGAET